MEASSACASASSERSLRRKAPRMCYCPSPQKPVLVVSWTDNNLGRRFYGCSNYWIGKKCKFFQWVDDEICERGKVLIPEMRVLEEYHATFVETVPFKSIATFTINSMLRAALDESSSMAEEADQKVKDQKGHAQVESAS
nr:hypothetical protein CFP56_27985 [Quercus suber]